MRAGPFSCGLLAEPAPDCAALKSSGEIQEEEAYPTLSEVSTNAPLVVGEIQITLFAERRTGYFDKTNFCCTLSFEMEHSFTCPYCGEEISMILDLSVRRQTYVEDCEVCCNPIEVNYTAQGDDLTSFSAKTLV